MIEGIRAVRRQLLFAGAGSLLPRLSSIVAGNDYSTEAILEVLQAKDGTPR